MSSNTKRSITEKLINKYMKNAFIFTWTKFRCYPWKLIDWDFKRFPQNNRWTIEIQIPFIHISYHKNYPK